MSARVCRSCNQTVHEVGGTWQHVTPPLYGPAHEPDPIVPHDQRPMETKRETEGGIDRAYVRYPCSCGWRGAWWKAPIDALRSHAAHRRQSIAAPAPPVEPALTPLLRALRRTCDECGSAGRCHPSCSFSAGAR